MEMTAAGRCMGECLAFAQQNDQVNMQQRFVQALVDPHDDPGYFDVLSRVADHFNLRRDVIWDEYGITDVGRQLLLQVTGNQAGVLIGILGQH
jgi:hypothetical protein